MWLVSRSLAIPDIGYQIHWGLGYISFCSLSKLGSGQCLIHLLVICFDTFTGNLLSQNSVFHFAPTGRQDGNFWAHTGFIWKVFMAKILHSLPYGTGDSTEDVFCLKCICGIVQLLTQLFKYMQCAYTLASRNWISSGQFDCFHGFTTMHALSSIWLINWETMFTWLQFNKVYFY